MSGTAIVFVLISICQVLVAGQNKTCDSCKIAFIAERTKTVSVGDRCRTLKNYVSCLTYTTKLSPGCPLSSTDISNIYDYENAMPYKSCLASDTCQCQIDRWTSSSSKSYMKYLGCLYDSVQPGCDGSPVASVIATAQLERSHYLTPRNVCDSTYGNYNSWNPSYNCEAFERYMKCLAYSATDGQGIPVNQTLQTSLDAIDSCEISMTDTCMCQTHFITPADSSDSCRVVKDYVSCLNNSFMRGCDRESLSDVKKTAFILQSQYCSNDTIYDCDGVALCPINMSSISGDQSQSETQRLPSCSLMKTFMECVKTHAPTCKAALSTVNSLNQTYNGMSCNYYLEKAKPTSSYYYPTSSYYYPSSSYYYPTSSYYYPTSSYYYPTSSYYYPTSSYYYPTSSYYYPTSSYYLPSTTAYPATGHGSGQVDATLLSAYIMSAKMEAEETLHAAQETVDAIIAAQKLVQ